MLFEYPIEQSNETFPYLLSLDGGPQCLVMLDDQPPGEIGQSDAKAPCVDGGDEDQTGICTELDQAWRSTTGGLSTLSLTHKAETNQGVESLGHDSPTHPGQPFELE